MAGEQQGDSWMDQRGALIGAREGAPAAVEAAFETALRESGYRPLAKSAAKGPGELSLQRFAGNQGAWIVTSIEAGTARHLATRLAAHAGVTSWLLVARATFREGAKPACLFDASEATIDPRGKAGGASPSALEDLEWSKEDLDTDKPWRLVEITLDFGLEAWVDGRKERGEMRWAPPSRLENPRLDALARQIRAGGTAERTVVAGRTALRVRSAEGAVSTAFLSDEEIASVLAACPGIELRGA